MRRRILKSICLFVVLSACFPSALLAAGLLGVGKKSSPPKPTPPSSALQEYINRVRTQSAAEVRTPGAIWSPTGSLTRLGADVKAVHLHDVVSIVVSESLAASTDGSVKNSRASSASSAVSSLFSKLSASNSLNNLVGQNSASALTAQGQSVTNSSLATILGGEVVDVLPNGMMVIQATRQLTFSQQTQLIRLRGMIRPEDVNAENQVASTAITDMELEVVGKGIINDYTYRQNPLVRWLERLVIF
jgi:flagellar L-ring protein FlgH